MYRNSKDRRFQKNKRALRRAFIDLTIEKGYQNLTITDLTERADLNRMTFYSHYDSIEDVFAEFVDDMEREIEGAISKENEFTIDRFIGILNPIMYREIDFFRYVAKEGNCYDFKTSFKDTIGKLIKVDGAAGTAVTESQQNIISDLCAVCIAYSYLDWLAGDYGDAELEQVLSVTKDLLKDHLPWVIYR